MVETIVRLFNPFYTHFVLETADGWRYHSYTYDAHVMLSLFRSPESIRAVRELHYYHSEKWEKELEAKHKLPRGHLRGVFDVHRSMAEVESIAASEGVRLRPTFELGLRDKGASGMGTHVNLVLVYKVSATGNIEAIVSKEVVAEIRTHCSCVMCIPMPRPINIVQHRCQQCLSDKCNCPVHSAKKGTVLRPGPPLVLNHNYGTSLQQYPVDYSSVTRR
jgi:hypothetical protein